MIPGYQHRHLGLVEDYAQRHYTDPNVALADAAVFYGLDERTLRRSLAHCGTSWRALLHELRCQRAAELLESTAFKIDYVARLAGYSSTSAFGQRFRKRYSSTPSEYRRGKKGPARAGGVTGAFARGSRRPSSGADGWFAIHSLEQHEARERVNDRRQLRGDDRLEPTLHTLFGREVEEERDHPRWLREDAAYWKQVARDRRRAEQGAVT